MTPKDWFRLFAAHAPKKDLSLVRAGIELGHLNAVDEYGMSALHLAVSTGWLEGMAELLSRGADTSLRHHRTGATALHTAVQEKNRTAIRALIAAGANPEAANYWGVTPRQLASTQGVPGPFEAAPERTPEFPALHIQNAEHLADHYHPRFKIPKRSERETLTVGQAVNLHVHGPRNPAVKVRIERRAGEGAATEYWGRLDPADQETNLPAGTSELHFRPEHVATVWLQRPA